MHLSGKKIFLFGFIAVLLIGIPLTIYLVQQQQNTRSRAEASTNLSFTPDSTVTTPIQSNVGDSIPLDIFADPGTNLITSVIMEIQYDPEKLATASAEAFTQNISVLSTVLEGPIYSPGKISFTLTAGTDPGKLIKTKTKIATVTFKALAATATGSTTQVIYGPKTQVLSSGSNDQSSENVLASSTPANIAIAAVAVTPTVTPDVTVTPTTPTETVTPTLEVTPTTVATGSANQVPVCTTLDVDRTPSGDAPLSLTFTANGTDVDGTISKVTFNFGDGQVSDVTTGGGIGTATANTAVSHTYNNAGTFTASALLTDSSSGVSDSTSCKQTVTVTASGSAVTTAPTIAPTGSVAQTIGIAALIFTFILGGGFLFFLL